MWVWVICLFRIIHSGVYTHSRIAAHHKRSQFRHRTTAILTLLLIDIDTRQAARRAPPVVAVAPHHLTHISLLSSSSLRIECRQRGAPHVLPPPAVLYGGCCTPVVHCSRPLRTITLWSPVRKSSLPKVRVCDQCVCHCDFHIYLCPLPWIRRNLAETGAPEQFRPLFGVATALVSIQCKLVLLFVVVVYALRRDLSISVSSRISVVTITSNIWGKISMNV